MNSLEDELKVIGENIIYKGAILGVHSKLVRFPEILQRKIYQLFTEYIILTK